MCILLSLLLACFLIASFFFFSLKQGLTMYPWLTWTSGYKPGYSQIHRHLLLLPPSTGIKGMYYHIGLNVHLLASISINLLNQVFLLLKSSLMMAQ